MRTRMVYGLLALGSLVGMGVVASRHPQWTSPKATQVVMLPADPTEGINDLDVKTGDSFWGLHLDGVVPCSSMLVKGGGHLVIISRKANHEAQCYFHVKETKNVELAGTRFKLEVVAPDHIHVTRELLSPVAMAAR